MKPLQNRMASRRTARREAKILIVIIIIIIIFGISSACAASAAEAAAKRQEENFIEISRNYHLFPITSETFGSINQIGMNFISALGHRISSITDDRRFNTVIFSNSFCHNEHRKPSEAHL